MRHTTFRFALAPTSAQAALLARYAGASRFAYNQCLQLVIDALAARRADPQATVPWTGFDLINAVNAWKQSEDAGRIFVVSTDGAITKQVTGLPWRHDIAAQVFEEAAVDLGWGLVAYAKAKRGVRSERVGFPRRKRKGRCHESFRLRNRRDRRGTFAIRVGDGHPRSVTLPRIGTVRVCDNTRRLRRLLRPVEHLDPATGKPIVSPRAKLLFATVRRHGGRWYVSLNVQAPDLHRQLRHPPRGDQDHGGWVGIDRGLAAFVVAATTDGTEVGRFHGPKALQRNMVALRQRSRVVARTQRRSRNRAEAIRRLSRMHARIADTRRSFLHEVSSRLVKTHDRLCLEDLAVANLMRNKYLARAIGDAAWAELARQVVYKQAWRGGQVVLAERWLASTKTCSRCGLVKQRMRLAERAFRCETCGLVMDRDCNAAANLAAWAEAASVAAARVPDRQAGGRVTNAPGGEGAGYRPGDGATGPDEGGTEARAIVACAKDTREGCFRANPSKVARKASP
jgi:putative transposase